MYSQKVSLVELKTPKKDIYDFEKKIFNSYNKLFERNNMRSWELKNREMLNRLFRDFKYKFEKESYDSFVCFMFWESCRYCSIRKMWYL